MKLKVYMRVAHGTRGPRVDVSTSPNYKPLESGAGWNAKALPTAMFALELTIPDEAMHHAERVMAELEIPADAIEVAAGVGRA